MALYFPDILEHNNPDYALLDDFQLRGGAVSVATKAARNSIAIDKRKLYSIVSYDDEGIVTKRYEGSSLDDADWQNDINWSEIGGGSSISFGLEGDIPFTNLDNNDFDYSGTFNYDGERLLVTDINSNLLIGQFAGDNFDGNVFNLALGRGALGGIKSDGNVGIGDLAGSFGDFGSLPSDSNVGFIQTSNNISLGNNAGHLDFVLDVPRPNTENNISIGNDAGNSSFGIYNIAIGTQALQYSLGDRNVAIGTGSGSEAGNTYVNEKDYNVFLGYNSGSAVAGDTSRSIHIGANSGRLSKGVGNIFIGTEVGFQKDVSNKLYIHNAVTNEPLIEGDFANNSLSINGSLSIRDAENIETSTVLYYNEATGLVTYGLAPQPAGGGGGVYFECGRTDEVYQADDNVDCGSVSDIQNVYIDCGESIRII